MELREEGIPLDEMAVLFRSSFHSFDLEDPIVAQGIAVRETRRHQIHRGRARERPPGLFAGHS